MLDCVAIKYACVCPMFVFSRDHVYLCILHPVTTIFITSYKGCVIQAEGTVLIQPNLFSKQIDSILKERLVNELGMWNVSHCDIQSSQFVIRKFLR